LCFGGGVGVRVVGARWVWLRGVGKFSAG
jgi:hypothetical protein